MGVMAQLQARASIREKAKLEAIMIEEKLIEIDSNYFKGVKGIGQSSKVILFNAGITNIEQLRGKSREELTNIGLNYPSSFNIINHFKELDTKELTKKTRQLEEDGLDNKLPDGEVVEVDTQNIEVSDIK